MEGYVYLFQNTMPNFLSRAFTDPEIIDALLLHHIGVAWQVKLKAALVASSTAKPGLANNPLLPKSGNNGSCNSVVTMADLP